jgi:hypothetical protein
MARVTEQREPALDGREETSRERLDRNLSELTGELRVAVTGVQVLFAFLLVVPFDARFARLASYQRDLSFATLLLSALSAVCVIAPSAQHRILFRRDEKAYLVSRASALTLAGLALLGLAMCCALTLVASDLFGALAGIVTGAAMAAPFALLWFAAPLRRARARGDRSRPGLAPSPRALRR